MGRFQKRIKKYERHLLVVLVVLLLVTFSVGGALSCQMGSSGGKDWGGDFDVTPSTRGSLSSTEYIVLSNRLRPFQSAVGTSSLKYTPQRFGITEPREWQGVWTHALPVEAAKNAGYVCGEGYQLPTAIRRAVQGAQGGIEFNDASYDRFLRDWYRRGATAFQDTLREVVIKDAFLRPLIETPRYGIAYSDAYDVWKKLLRRVELDYVALRGEDFGLAARQRETTRTRISLQDRVFLDVSTTARTIDGQRLRLEGWHRRRVSEETRRLKDAGSSDEEAAAKAEELVTWPQDLKELGGATPKDAWDAGLRYAPDGETFDIRSAGPDGEFDTSDDVTIATAAEIRTRVALREVGDALQRWHEATSAWPESLDAMREAPAEGALAPLTRDTEDGWKQPLVYEAGAEGAAPRLYSLGPDGEALTTDDVAALVATDSLMVPPGVAFIPFLADADKDAWDRPMRIDFNAPIRWGWDVSSAGPDGAFGTDDDVTEGNRAELERFFRRTEVRSEYVEPARRELESIYVHLPLVPDEAFAALWEKFPQHRSTDEMFSFEEWRKNRTYEYIVEDPADPENGHGVDQARAIDADAKLVLVPDAAIFGETPEDLLVPGNPDMVAYVEKGWRQVVLRREFFEQLLVDLLGRARDSQEAVQVWEEKQAALAAARAEGVEELPEDPGEKPVELTFEGLLASELGSVLPAEGEAPWLGHERTDGPVEQTIWEGSLHTGDLNLSTNMQRVTEAGEYAPIPINLHNTHTKAIVRNILFLAPREKDLDEVYDAVFERHLEGKQLDLAEEALRDLKARVHEANVTSGPDDPPDGAPEREPDAAPVTGGKDIWDATVAAWAKDLGLPHFAEGSGWFVGARPPAARNPGEDVAADRRAFLARRDFVRTTGYDTIRTAVGQGEDPVVGLLGRDVLRDDVEGGTDAVYLVRLADVREPPPEAFSPRDYADYLTAEIIGSGLPKGGFGLGGAAGGERVDVGVIQRGVKEFFGDYDYLARKFGLVLNQDPAEKTEE